MHINFCTPKQLAAGIAMLFLSALPSFTATAQTGAALNFDGSNDYITLGNSATLSPSAAFTYEAWINPDAFTDAWGGAGFIMMSGRDCCGWLNGGMGMHLTNINGAQSPRVYFYRPDDVQVTLVGTSLTTGNWHHIAMVFDGVSLKLYQDGVLSASSSFTATTMKLNAQALDVGRHNNGGTSAFYFHGSMDEVRVWNVALSQAEVLNHKDCEVPATATGLVANYHLNQGIAGGSNGTEATLTDATGNGNTGTLSGFTLSGSTSNWISPGAPSSGISCPALSSFTPATGAVGTVITINGSGLDNATNVTIGGTAALIISNTATTVTAMVMPGTTTGIVSVTAASSTASSGASFIPIATSYPAIQQGNKLVGTGGSSNAQQGYSAAISADGQTCIVGGTNDNSAQGAAWVYTRSGNTWTQQAKLVGTGNIGAAFQGRSVALSADGNTAIIGGNNDNATIGAAWIFTRSGSSWSQQTKLIGTGYTGGPHQGHAVSLSADGNTAVVTGPQDNSNIGAAWVFTRSGSSWTQQGSKLVGTGNIGNSFQGGSVSISADGNTLMSGAGSDNTNQGAAWIFTRSGGIWSQQTKLTGTGNTGAAGLGVSVSLSADGNTAAAGATYNNFTQGAVWIFVRTGSSWSQQTILSGSSSADAYQGSSVSVSADGNTMIESGYYDNDGLGAMWVFTRSGSTWSLRGKLVGNGGDADASQGTSIGLSADGGLAIDGAPFDGPTSQGAAWLFVSNLNWTGALSSDWNTAGNWSPAKLPDLTDNVSIPATGVTNEPSLPSLTTIAGLSIATGRTLTLNNNLTINGGLTLSGGNIVLGNFNLSATALTGGSSTSFVRTTGTGTFKLPVAGVAVTFPVGNTVYNPITLTNAGTADNFSVRVTNNALSGGTTGTALSNPVINRTWHVAEDVNGGSDVTMTLRWNSSEDANAFDYTHVYIAHHNGTGWENYNIDEQSAPAATGYPGAGPYTVSRAGISSFSPFTIGSAGAFPLAIITGDITAVNKGMINLVSWTNLSEQAGDEMELQRSGDGNSFETVNIQTAKGISKTVYQYADAQPFTGNNYYRIQVKGADGRKLYCKTVMVVVQKSKVEALVYPNPAKDKLNIVVANDGTMIIATLEGKTAKTVTIKAGKNEIDIRDLAAGPYLIYGIGAEEKQYRLVKE